MSVDLHLVGHDFQDSLYFINDLDNNTCKSSRRNYRPGGVYNLYHYWPNDLSLVTSSANAEAIILQDWTGKRKTILHNLQNIKLKDVKSKWTHIAYLDNILDIDLNFLRDRSDVLSVDIAHGDLSFDNLRKMHKLVQLVDYIFISHELIYKIPMGMLSLGEKPQELKPKLGIFNHSPAFCYYEEIDKNPDEYEYYHNEYYQGALTDTVGAGDILCCKIIENLIRNKTKSEAVADAQKFVYDNLIKRKLNK